MKDLLKLLVALVVGTSHHILYLASRLGACMRNRKVQEQFMRTLGVDTLTVLSERFLSETDFGLFPGACGGPNRAETVERTVSIILFSG